MVLLPPALEGALARAPRVVVAPVGVGFGQGSLVAWARRENRAVLRDPAAVGLEPALLLPTRRSSLGAFPPDLSMAEALVLDESDLIFDATAWQGALSGSTRDFVAASFAESEGLPLGLELASRISKGETPLHQHPLASLLIERLLPEGPTRQELIRTAPTPVLIPELIGPLGVSPESVDELLDTGFLLPRRNGLVMTRLLRRYLRPKIDPAESLAVAHILLGRRLLDPALEVLADAEQWGTYLDVLAEGFEPSSQGGEAQLRTALSRLPVDFHGEPAYLYLVGSLERMRGELDRARKHYGEARKSASKGLKPRIDNARGITFALLGRPEAALRAFGAAIRGVPRGTARIGSRRGGSAARLEAEGLHNRAGVFIQGGRFGEAERDLRQAIANFRRAGDYVREARSLQLLALSWHQRGLLQEARKGYEEALELLGTLAQPTALLRTNLAEVLLLGGRSVESRTQLELAAAEAQNDERAMGYVETNLAQWLLEHGRVEPALRKLASLLRQEGVEAHLRAEAELLTARALRRQGRRQEAVAHAKAAAPLGVAASLEVALCGEGDLDRVIEQARAEQARFELVLALLHRGQSGDLEEALALIRTHDYRSLLNSPEHAPALAALAQKEPTALELFPLRLRTFGGFRARFLGRELTLAEFPTRKSAALLVRLALASRRVGREALAEEFWGDAGNPVHSVQTALYHLNRTLNAQVIGGRRGAVGINFPIVLDLTEFESAATEALEGSWTRGPEAVRRALELVEGEPLSEFPEWFEEERRAAEVLALRLWRRLAELEAGRPAEAAEALESLLRLDPYDVGSHRALIEIYSGMGEVELARRQEEQLRSRESEIS